MWDQLQHEGLGIAGELHVSLKKLINLKYWGCGCNVVVLGFFLYPRKTRHCQRGPYLPFG